MILLETSRAERVPARATPMRWAYTGSWEHLDKLGPLLAPVFRALPEWARPCPMSVDLMRLAGQFGAIFAVSSALMRIKQQPSNQLKPEQAA